MKKILLILLALAVSTPLHSSSTHTWWDGSKKEGGRITETQSITITTHTATEIVAADFWQVNVDVFVNNAYTLWVGTNTTTLLTTGFPILSSTTYTLDGGYTGTVYGTADPAAGGDVNVRIIRYQMK